MQDASESAVVFFEEDHVFTAANNSKNKRSVKMDNFNCGHPRYTLVVSLGNGTFKDFR